MLRVIVYLLIAAGAAYSIEPIRVRLAPVTLRVWAHIDPAVRKVTDPVRASITQREENALVGQLRQVHSAGQALPSPDKFQSWLVLSSSVGEDGWGNDYYLVVNGDSVLVGSRGPDGVRGTKDDILTKCNW